MQTGFIQCFIQYISCRKPYYKVSLINLKYLPKYRHLQFEIIAFK